MTAQIIQFVPRPNLNRQDAGNLALIDDPIARRIAHSLFDREPIIDTSNIGPFYPTDNDCA